MQANQVCRKQIDQSIQDIFAKNDINVPADTSFRLTVDNNYSIHVIGLEDKNLAATIEQALNSGDNGKNLYNHLKVTFPGNDPIEVDYVNGHLEDLDTQLELGDKALNEVRKQTCPAYTQFSATYDPKRNALMDDRVIGINTDLALYGR